MSIVRSVLQSLRSPSALTWRPLQQKRFVSRCTISCQKSPSLADIKSKFTFDIRKEAVAAATASWSSKAGKARTPKPSSSTTNSKPEPPKPKRHHDKNHPSSPKKTRPSSLELTGNPFAEIISCYNRVRTITRTPAIEAKYSTAVIVSVPPNIINSGFNAQLPGTLLNHRRNYNNGFFLHIQSSDRKHISPLATVRRKTRTKVRAAFFNVVEKDKIILGNLHNNENNGIYDSDGLRHRYVNSVKRLTEEERSARRVLKGTLILSLNFDVILRTVKDLEAQIRMILQKIEHVVPDVDTELRMKPKRLEKMFEMARDNIMDKALSENLLPDGLV